jgi:molybdate transport system permease protein
VSEVVFSESKYDTDRKPIRKLGCAWWIMSVPLIVYIILPVLALLLSTSPEELFENIQLPEVYQAIYISLLTSTAAAGTTVIFGIPIAYLMARKEFRFKRLVDSALDLPIVLPPAVAGLALLMVYGRRGLIGGWLDSVGLQIAFTPIAVIMAMIFISAPLFIKSAAIGFGNIEPELEQAASLDGASPWYIFRMITLPLSRVALLGGLVLTWTRALGEFGATIIFAGNFPGITQTMPLAIYLGFELDMEIAITLSVILILISFFTLVLLKGFFLEKD